MQIKVSRSVVILLRPTGGNSRVTLRALSGMTGCNSEWITAQVAPFNCVKLCVDCCSASRLNSSVVISIVRNSQQSSWWTLIPVEEPFWFLTSPGGVWWPGSIGSSQQASASTKKPTEKRVSIQRCSDNTGWMTVSSIIAVRSMATPFFIRFYSISFYGNSNVAISEQIYPHIQQVNAFLLFINILPGGSSRRIYIWKPIHERINYVKDKKPEVISPLLYNIFPPAPEQPK